MHPKKISFPSPTFASLKTKCSRNPARATVGIEVSFHDVGRGHSQPSLFNLDNNYFVPRPKYLQINALVVLGTLNLALSACACECCPSGPGPTIHPETWRLPTRSSGFRPPTGRSR